MMKSRRRDNLSCEFISFILITFLLFLQIETANASITIVGKEGWQIDTDGRVNGYAAVVDGEEDVDGWYAQV